MKRGGTKRKIEIKARDTPQQRSVTCSKRRKTVFSKAADLCHLAGANVAVFVPAPAENSDVVYSFSGYGSACEIAECYLNGKSPPPPPQVINEGGFWWEDPDFLRYRESDDLSQLQVMEDCLLRSKTHLMAFLEKKQNTQIVSTFDQNHIDRATSCSSPGQNPTISQNPNFFTQSSSPIVSTCDPNLVNGAGSSSHHHFFSSASSQIASFGQNSYPSFEKLYGEPSSSQATSSDNGGDDLSYLMNEGEETQPQPIINNEDPIFGLSPLQDEPIINNEDPSFWDIVSGLPPLQDEPIINNEDPSFWDIVSGLSPLQDYQDKWMMDKWMMGDEVIMTA